MTLKIHPSVGIARLGNSPEQNIVETEWVNELFSYKDVGVGEISGNQEDDETTIPVYFIEADKQLVRGRSGSEQVSSRNSIHNIEGKRFQLDREKFDLLMLSKVVERGGRTFPEQNVQAFYKLKMGIGSCR